MGLKIKIRFCVSTAGTDRSKHRKYLLESVSDEQIVIAFPDSNLLLSVERNTQPKVPAGQNSHLL
jgi:hypothetical protein